MKYDAVIFDLDGTLMDTSDGVIKSIEYTIEKLGYEPLTSDVVRTFIGPPIQNSFRNTYGLNDEETAKAASTFRNAYKDVFLFNAEIYTGMLDFLKKLRSAGIKTSVATYKREDYTRKLLDKFELKQYFDFIMGSDMEGKLTKSDIVKSCIEFSGVDRSKTVLVGDTVHDAVGAQQQQVDFIGVTFGFGFKTKQEAKDAGAVTTADNILELQEVLFGKEKL